MRNVLSVYLHFHLWCRDEYHRDDLWASLLFFSLTCHYRRQSFDIITFTHSDYILYFLHDRLPAVSSLMPRRHFHLFSASADNIYLSLYLLKSIRCSRNIDSFLYIFHLFSLFMHISFSIDTHTFNTPMIIAWLMPVTVFSFFASSPLYFTSSIWRHLLPVYCHWYYRQRYIGDIAIEDYITALLPSFRILFHCLSLYFILRYLFNYE